MAVVAPILDKTPDVFEENTELSIFIVPPVAIIAFVSAPFNPEFVIVTELSVSSVASPKS